jgi:GNAT superfamily N-acetyltransferase
VDSQSLQIEVEPAPRDVQFLKDRLYDYNVEQTGFADGKSLAIFVRDDGGVIVAGIQGWTWGGACWIEDFWIRSDLRRHGSGTRLLAAAEQEARARSCDAIFLYTFGFQAPMFYQKKGYEILHVVDDFPRRPHKQYYLKKMLTRPG